MKTQKNFLNERFPNQKSPAEVGMNLGEVDTPALLVDLDAFESNMDRMANETATHGVRLRPHAKTHKCAVIALQQISRGAVGMCCQKVSEAEALIHNGINDVFVTNEVVDRRKLERLASLATEASVAICVDHLDNVDLLGETANNFDVRIDVLIEVDVGGNRCGVSPGEAVLFLADRIASFRSLRFRGVQAYQGRAQHIRAHSERKKAIEQSSLATQSAVEMLTRQGFACDVIAGGGTGTCEFEMASGMYNEVQPGSYIFMDVDYSNNESSNSLEDPKYRQSLFVCTQVMSVPNRSYAVVDAGLKALSFDSGMPLVADLSNVSYHRPSDEHGVLETSKISERLRLGAKLKLIPGHCDPTVNLYDWLVAFRGDRVEGLWPVVGRGALS
jgi:3-hydroxy-D-aspartate aldolase